MGHEEDDPPKQKTQQLVKTTSKIISKSQFYTGKEGESKNELNEYINTNFSPSQDDQYLKKPENNSPTFKQGPSSIAISQNDPSKTQDV